MILKGLGFLTLPTFCHAEMTLVGLQKVGCLFRHYGNSHKRRTRRAKGVQNPDGGFICQWVNLWKFQGNELQNYVVVWNMFYVYSYLEQDSYFDEYVSPELKPPTRQCAEIYSWLWYSHSFLNCNIVQFTCVIMFATCNWLPLFLPDVWYGMNFLTCLEMIRMQ